MSASGQPANTEIEEHEVRKALSTYKMALVCCHYRNWWHRFLLWSGQSAAIAFEQALVDAEANARLVCNQSENHRRWVMSLPYKCTGCGKSFSLLFAMSDISQLKNIYSGDANTILANCNIKIVDKFNQP